MPLGEAASFDEIEERIAAFIRDNHISKGQWVAAQGFEDVYKRQEVGLHMPKGQTYVMEQLRGYGLDPHPCGHGVIAELGQEGGRTILLLSLIHIYSSQLYRS